MGCRSNKRSRRIKRQRRNVATKFLSMPDELLVEIILRLPAATCFYNMAFACKNLSVICQDEYVEKKLLKKFTRTKITRINIEDAEEHNSIPRYIKISSKLPNGSPKRYIKYKKYTDVIHICDFSYPNDEETGKYTMIEEESPWNFWIRKRQYIYKD